MEELPRATGQRCDTCWLPLFQDACLSCRHDPPRLTHLRSVFLYKDEVRGLVSAFKFRDQSSMAQLLGELLAAKYEAEDLAVDVVAPVPLTGIRKRQRGYNQSLLMAREMAERVALPCEEVLRRKGYVEPQVASKGAEERRQKVQGVFEVALPGAIRDRHVLLIDDVATTGATLDACADVLLQGGASAVSALTLARED